MSQRKKSGIYAIVNTTNQKSYVGQAISIGDRWLYHLSSLRRGKHSNIKLQRAWAKYGADAFSFKVLEYVQIDRDLLAEREQFWIDLICPYYNIAPVAGSSIGMKHPPRSDEFRAKMSAFKKGFKHSPETIERLRQISAASTYRPSPEHIEKMRAIHTGRKKSPEEIEKHRLKMIGKKQSAEHIEKRVKHLIGRPVSDYTKQKIGESNRIRLTGKKQSLETIEKRAASLRGRTRPQHLIDTMHSALAAKRKPLLDAIRAALIADPDLNQTHLAERLGCGRDTIRKQKALLCQQLQQNDRDNAGKGLQPNPVESFRLP